MNASYEVRLLSIQQQIVRLEQEYQFALEQGKEFEQLKQIRLRLRSLEEKFSEIILAR
jgi:hypothetical protein